MLMVMMVKHFGSGSKHGLSSIFLLLLFGLRFICQCLFLVSVDNGKIFLVHRFCLISWPGNDHLQDKQHHPTGLLCFRFDERVENREREEK